MTTRPIETARTIAALVTEKGEGSTFIPELLILYLGISKTEIPLIRRCQSNREERRDGLIVVLARG